MTTETTETAEEKLAIDYDLINPGVRRLVRTLRDYGFETFASGDATDFGTHMPGSAEPSDLAYVVMRVKPEALVSEAKRLHEVMTAYGVKIATMDLLTDSDVEGPVIQAAYDPVQDIATIQVSGVLDKMMNEPS